MIKVHAVASSFLHYQVHIMKRYVISNKQCYFTVFYRCLIMHFFCASFKSVHDMVLVFTGIILKKHGNAVLLGCCHLANSNKTIVRNIFLILPLYTNCRVFLFIRSSSLLLAIGQSIVGWFYLSRRYDWRQFEQAFPSYFHSQLSFGPGCSCGIRLA